MWLVCSSKCGGTLFRAPSASVDVDSHGFYQAHHFDQPFFSCLGCGAPALDLAEVPAEAAAEAEADETAELIDVLCPVCETAVTLGPDGDCPNCGSPLAG